MGKKKNGYTYYKGEIEKSPENIINYLNIDPLYAGKIKLNTFTSRLEYNGKPFSDRDFECIASDVRSNLGFFNPTLVKFSISKMISDPTYQYSPLKDYLKGLAWDGNKRVETSYIDWLKADDTRLNRAFALKWFYGGVKRAMEPGCKFDNVVVLKGPQGIGKSLFCERLSAGFGTTSIEKIDNASECANFLSQNWICVINELRNLKKFDQDTVKDFFTRTKDSGRLPYDKYGCEYDRHCMFIGSTNDDTFLSDYSQMTERRYWVVNCNATEEDGKYLFKNFTKDVVDQLWAEAYYMYKKDPNYELVLEPELSEMLKEDQKKYKTFSDDPTCEFLKDILTRKYPSKEFEYNQFKDMVERPSEYNGTTEIERIPVRFINYILSESRCASTRSAAWLKTVMGELGWKKCACVYKGTGRTEMCWKKIDSNGLFNDEE